MASPEGYHIRSHAPQILHAVMELEEQIVAKLNEFGRERDDRRALVTGVIRRICLGCGISLHIPEEAQIRHVDNAPQGVDVHMPTSPAQGDQPTGMHRSTPGEANTQVQRGEHQVIHLMSSDSVEGGIDWSVASSDTTGSLANLSQVGTSTFRTWPGILQPREDVSAVMASSHLAAQPPTVASHQRGLAAADSDGSEAVTDAQTRQAEISTLFSQMEDALDGMLEGGKNRKHVQKLISLTAKAIALPVPTDPDVIQDISFEYEKIRGEGKGPYDDLKSALKWAKSFLRDHPEDTDARLRKDAQELQNNISRLRERWSIQIEFARTLSAYNILLSDLPHHQANKHLSEVEHFLKIGEANTHDILHFLPADKLCEWLESAASCVRDGASRDYRLRLSGLMLRLKGRLADAMRQIEQGEGQFQQSGKRKHGRDSLVISTEPADSVYKRPKIESGTTQAVPGKGKNAEGCDTDQSSSRLRQRVYSRIQAKGGQAKESRDEGRPEEYQARDEQAKDGGDEGEPEDDQTERARIEFVLTRSERRPVTDIAEIIEATKAVSGVLGQARDSLFARYINRTCDADKVKNEGSNQHTGTYYQKMVTLSISKLCSTPIPIKFRNSQTTIQLNRDQVIGIIEEVFGELFPNIFKSLFQALSRVKKDHTLEYTGTTASPLGQEVSLRPAVRKVQGMLDELEKLDSTAVQGHMRGMRLLFELRAIYDAVMNPSREISGLDAETQSTIAAIRDYTYTTHKQSQTVKSKARMKLAEILYPGDSEEKKSKALDGHRRSSECVSAMVRAFSVGCLWMQPKKRPSAFENISSGLDTIFKLIKESDEEGRVHNICRSLEELALAYTDAEPSMNVDISVLGELDEDPLQCITRLIKGKARVPSRVVE